MVATARASGGDDAMCHDQWNAVGAKQYLSDATTFDLEMKIATLVAI
jgi:hypothetical protein